MAGETPRQKKLKVYPIGSCHLDIAEVRTEEGKLSLFVAIDRSCNPRHDTLGLNMDRDGNVLDMLVQSRRNKQAAKKFFHKWLKGLTYVPWVIITDKLTSYGAAKQEILPGIEHRQHGYLNNRAENSHQPTCQREWQLQGFKCTVMLNLSSPHTGPLPSTSDRAATSSPLLGIAN
jgi:transposase-like protein